MKKMLILRGIVGHFAGKDWPHGALDEPSALEYARRRQYEGHVLDFPGWTGPNSEQVRLALIELRRDPDYEALFGFSGGAFNIRWILARLTPDERKRIKLVVVIGAPEDPPHLFAGDWELVYRTNPPTGHMDGPAALLREPVLVTKESQ